MTVLPRTLVEIQRVTQGVVLEFRPVEPVLVESANEGLPLRAGDDLRPLPEVSPTPDPPLVVVVHLRRPNALPPRRSDGGGDSL